MPVATLARRDTTAVDVTITKFGPGLATLSSSTPASVSDVVA